MSAKRQMARHLRALQARRPDVVVPLGELQGWFARAITHEGGLEAGLGESAALLDRYVTPGPRMSARDRLAIYHHAYHARLVEVLADDYPTLRHALGDDRFDALARAYVAAHPSRSPNLNAYGKYVSPFCAAHEGAFAGDLAALEWALVEAIHAEADPVLSLEGAQSIAPEAWPVARLRANPSVRVLRFDYPVNAYFQAIRDGEAPVLPAPAASAVVVYRRGTMLWRMDLSQEMAGVLEALVSGSPLGEAVESLAKTVADPNMLDEARASLMASFGQWVRSGIFAGVELPEAA